MDSSLLNIFHQLYDFSLYLRNHKIKSVLSDCDKKKKINYSKFTQQGGRQKRTAKRSCATKVTGLDRPITYVFCGDLHLS